jgi:PEGA domain
MKKMIVGFTLATFITGCSSTTVIKSDPSGARVYLNGEKVGITPYTHTDTKIIGSTNTVLLKKEGYQDTSAVFSRNENPNVGAIIGGVLVLFPFLWAMDYKPSYSYEMVPVKDDVKP